MEREHALDIIRRAPPLEFCRLLLYSQFFEPIGNAAFVLLETFSILVAVAKVDRWYHGNFSISFVLEIFAK